MQRVDIVGAGKSGLAAARALTRRGVVVTVRDRAATDALRALAEALAAEGIALELGVDYWPSAPVDLVVVSPGVPWDHPGLVEARGLGMRVIGEVELGWELLGPRPWVCVTGTNGKTTTTALIGAIFAEAGLEAPVCGNIGRPVCDLVLSGVDPDWVIAEVSSFQIESAPSLQPKIAVWTTFTPDHLNRHGTLANYAAIKNSLLVQAQTAIVNGDDPYLRKHLSGWSGRLSTGIDDRSALAHVHGDWIVLADEPLMRVAEVRLIGRHNLQNVLMAVAAAHAAGLDRATTRRAVAAFRGVPHRLEPVGIQEGITFINDSKATNYDAALVGLQAVGGPTVLIAGGQAKEGEPSAWLAAIAEHCTAVVLIGEASDRFAAWLAERGYAPVHCAHDLERAVPLTLELARRTGAGRVLFSPACASFDQFRNFEERGQRFGALVAALRSGPSR